MRLYIPRNGFCGEESKIGEFCPFWLADREDMDYCTLFNVDLDVFEENIHRCKSCIEKFPKGVKVSIKIDK